MKMFLFGPIVPSVPSYISGGYPDDHKELWPWLDADDIVGRGQPPRRPRFAGPGLVIEVTGRWSLPPSWMSKGSCVGIDPELFFPEVGAAADVRYLKRLCRECVVLNDCRDYATARPELLGIWGGQSERTRQRNRQRCREAA